MKKFIIYILGICFLFFIFFFKEDISGIINIFENKQADVIIRNSYYNPNKYLYFTDVEDFNPKNKNDLINIYYTVINAGMKSFTFYCSSEYTNCIDDVDAISNNRFLLSNINNFVHVYNSFEDIETIRYKSNGKVTINVNYIYNDQIREQINNKIDEILNSIIKDDMSDEDKIKAIHDYIIENSKYDSLRSDENINKYASNLAYGPLFEGYGICSGYSDLFQLFMNKINIKNIKISTENHIWNLVFLNNKWLHIDLTWDDPITSTGEDIIDYEYFLITSDELYELNDNQHLFDKDIYKEAIL